MKKHIALFLTTLLLLAPMLGGCSDAQSSYRMPLSFYYPCERLDFSQGGSYIGAEVREGDETGGELSEILALYLLGPLDTERFFSPFPAQTRLEHYVLEESVLEITLSAEFSACTDSDLTVACACLAKTCLSLTQAQTVRIRCEGAQLADADYVELDEQSILLVDDVVASRENS